MVLSIKCYGVNCLPSSRWLWTRVPGLTSPLVYLPQRGRGKEVSDEPLLVEELDDESKNTLLDLGSRYGRGGGNKLEGGMNQVDVACRQELDPFNTTQLRVLSGGNEEQEPVPVEEPAKVKEVDDIKNRGVVGKTHVREGVGQRGV